MIAAALACATAGADQQPFSDAEKVQYRGRYAGAAFAEDKINYSVAWNWNNLTVSYLGEYVSKLDADTFCNCNTNPYIQKIDDVLYHDIAASYTFASDPSTYRMFGRGYYLRLNQKL